jgi:hypothetical protein
MIVLHAFEENLTSSRNEHIKRYFGHTPPSGEEEREDGSFVICYCGGRIVPLGVDKNNEKIGAIWHRLVMGDRMIKDGFDE